MKTFLWAAVVLALEVLLTCGVVALMGIWGPLLSTPVVLWAPEKKGDCHVWYNYADAEE